MVVHLEAGVVHALQLSAARAAKSSIDKIDVDEVNFASLLQLTHGPVRTPMKVIAYLAAFQCRFI